MAALPWNDDVLECTSFPEECTSRHCPREVMTGLSIHQFPMGNVIKLRVAGEVLCYSIPHLYEYLLNQMLLQVVNTQEYHPLRAPGSRDEAAAELSDEQLQRITTLFRRLTGIPQAEALENIVMVNPAYNRRRMVRAFALIQREPFVKSWWDWFKETR